MQIQEALTFDDVLLQPAESAILPHEADTRTKLTKSIDLRIPVISSAMDTVTEAPLAIAMAQAGGIGVIHKNLEIAEQAEEVRRVKRFEAGMVINPITITPDQTLVDALTLMQQHNISGIPVVSRRTGRIAGILTNRDVRFARDENQPVRELMTKRGLVTVPEGVAREEAMRLLHKHRIEKLIVIDEDRQCVGLITVKDIEKAQRYPDACKDEQGRLRVAAATCRQRRRRTGGSSARCRLRCHRRRYGTRTQPWRAVGNRFNQAAKQLYSGYRRQRGDRRGRARIDRCGCGRSESRNWTRFDLYDAHRGRRGRSRLTAIMEAAESCRAQNVPVIADGGIKFSGDIAKAIAAGADSVMIGSLFAGTDEAPGEVMLYQGRSYKSYRGMGSIGAMARGSADRYFQEEVSEQLKLVPEGVEGRVPYKGPIGNILHQLVGGLKAAMGYTGSATLADMHSNTSFRRITGAGLRESHVHDISVTQEAPNYRVD